MSVARRTLQVVLSHWGINADDAVIERAPSGLIQTTFLVQKNDGERFVLQRMHEIFGAQVLEDIDAVTMHLEAAGMDTPRPVRTEAGDWVVHDDEGRLWRLLTFLAGVTIDRVTDAAIAEQAGQLVGRFHRALSDLRHDFVFTRSGVHDTVAHLSKLESLAGYAQDGRVRRLAADIVQHAHGLPTLGALPNRVTHGDLKISNVLFHGGADHSARALIDLDTLGRQTLACELGDALRSWCNPAAENVEDTRFDLSLFSAALSGYAQSAGGMLTQEERDSLLLGTATICIELAARFCADAIEDKYFGWDPEHFPSRKEHNRVRAVGQLTLARAVWASRTEAEKIVSNILG